MKTSIFLFLFFISSHGLSYIENSATRLSLVVNASQGLTGLHDQIVAVHIDRTCGYIKQRGSYILEVLNEQGICYTKVLSFNNEANLAHVKCYTPCEMDQQHLKRWR